MNRSRTSVDDFLARPDRHSEALRELDSVIVSAMPNRSRTLWEGVFWGGTDQQIIDYGDMIQPRSRGESVEWFVVGLARQKRNFSLYVNAVEDGQYLGTQYAERLGKVKLGAASIAFTDVEHLDLGVLAEMAAHADRLSPPANEAHG